MFVVFYWPRSRTKIKFVANAPRAFAVQSGIVVPPFGRAAKIRGRQIDTQPRWGAWRVAAAWVAGPYD